MATRRPRWWPFCAPCPISTTKIEGAKAASSGAGRAKGLLASWRALGKYNLYLGGGAHGQRLNKMYRENVGEEAILAALDKVLGHYAHDRRKGEPFGDFAIRAGYVAEVREGRHFND